jgi:hypothetical protein
MGNEFKDADIVFDIPDLWVVSRNSDLTEGKGYEVIVAHCDCETTARRIARRINVQGSDGYVYQCPTFKIGTKRYAPVTIIRASAEDEKIENRKQKVEALKSRLLDTGVINQEEIDLLTEEALKDTR